MSDTAYLKLPVLTHVILTIALRGKYYYYCHFTEEKTESLTQVYIIRL